MNKKENEDNTLLLIPKATNYIEYMLDIIMKLPRTEKFNIGNEYKESMYKMLETIIYLQKIEKYKKIEYLNKIDCELNIQRIMLRLMNKEHWIDNKKFKVSIEKLRRNWENCRRAYKILWQEQLEMNLTKS